MEDEILDPPSDIWRHFHPKTNLVWAHFILYKLLEHLEGNEPTNLSGKELLRNVEVNIEDRSKVGRKAIKLYKVLERVAELLEPSALAKKDSLGSMKELVVLAMEERWLRTSDVSGP
jgi:serine/threonine-protein kinase haspin